MNRDDLVIPRPVPALLYETMLGPFSLKWEQGGWEIYDCSNTPLVRLTGQLIDGSGRREQYPDGVIRSRETRAAEAEFVHRAISSHCVMLAALEEAQELFEKALPKFNWGASFLDAEAITLLNEVPVLVKKAIRNASPGGIPS